MNENGVKLDMGAAWNDAVALMKANKDIIIVLAGLFLFLPSVAMLLILGDPPISFAVGSASQSQMMLDWIAGKWPIIFIISLVSMLGTLALYFVVLNPAKPTVGDSLKMAAAVFIFYFVAEVLAGLAMVFGLLLLVVPGIYLMVKFALVPAVAAAENERNPIEMLRKSWHLTKGNSLSFFGFILLVGIAAFVAMLVVSLIIGTLLGLILPDSMAVLASGVVDTLLQTIVSVVMLHIYMAVYRQLSGQTAA